MVVAVYKNNSKSAPEQIRVHKFASDGKLRVESITNSYAHEVGGVYETLEDVEKYLENRDSVFGYTRII